LRVYGERFRVQGVGFRVKVFGFAIRDHYSVPHAGESGRPYTLLPTPYTLLRTPYTLHPTPYFLLPTPYTLHPTLRLTAGKRQAAFWERNYKSEGTGVGRRRGKQSALREPRYAPVRVHELLDVAGLGSGPALLLAPRDFLHCT